MLLNMSLIEFNNHSVKTTIANVIEYKINDQNKTIFVVQ